MKILYQPEFIRKLKQVNVRIRKSFRKKIAVFQNNPNDSSLNNHALKKEYSGYRSIDITADCRAIFEEIQLAKGGTLYYFLILGTHKELYGN